MKLSPIEKVLLNEVFSRTFFRAMKSKYIGVLLESTFPLYKKCNIGRKTQPFAPSRILLERRATGFALRLRKDWIGANKQKCQNDILKNSKFN